MKTLIRTCVLAVAAGTVALVAGILVADIRLPSLSPAALVFGDGKVEITFVGDIMLDRYIRDNRHPDSYYMLASDFTPRFYQSDLVVGNLEGTITNATSVSSNTSIGDAGNTKFTFAPQSLSFFTNHSFDLISLGNNHSRDFGTDGVRQTKSFLQQGGIAHIGDPTNPTETYTVTRDGVTMTFLAFNQFGDQTVTETTDAIRSHATASDWVIVYSHWGSEYTDQPTDTQRYYAQSFADAGADIIIGSHPHVWQPRNTIDDTVVYYSLGNFVFDQFFERDVRCGGVVTLMLTNDQIVTQNVTNSFITKKPTVRNQQCGIDIS